MTGGHERDLARVREALRQREAELGASRQQVRAVRQELEEARRGLVALRAGLADTRQSAARLAAIEECSDDAIFALTADGVILTWNPGAARLLGYAPAEILGQPVSVLAPAGPGDEFGAALKRARAGEQPGRFDTRRRRRDSSVAEVAVTLSALRDASGEVTGFSVVLRDISSRLRAAEELTASCAERELLAERDRVARDLHDRVIQRIFAAGMALQNAAGLVPRPEAAQRIQAVVTDLDKAIREIRETIFALRRGHGEARSLRSQVLGLVAESAGELGFTPDLSFDGPVDNVPEDVAVQLLPVIREALSNIARHAGATAASVMLTAGGELLLRVNDNDNGRGLGTVTREGGLASMRERAQILGGTFHVASEPAAWTQLEWRVPLRRD